MPAKKAPAAPADPTRALLADVVRALDDKKAEDLRVLRVSAQSTITDYLVLATGTSDPHLRALRVELEKVIDAARVPIAGMESSEGSGWTVVDAYQFASEWGGNSPEQRAATRACKAALAGEVDPETARGVFVAFARSKDILVEDTAIPILRKEQPSHV